MRVLKSCLYTSFFSPFVLPSFSLRSPFVIAYYKSAIPYIMDRRMFIKYRLGFIYFRHLKNHRLGI